MKKITKMAVLSLMLSLLFTATVLAAEPDEQAKTAVGTVNMAAEDQQEDNAELPYAASTIGCYTVSGIGSTYVPVATKSNGFNCNVTLFLTVPSGRKIDVAMYNGTTKIWEETNAFNGSRTFWCGSNVAAIYMRVTDSLGGPILNTYTCQVDIGVN